MRDAFVVTFFSALPQNALSRWMGRAFRAALPRWMTLALLRGYARAYRLDLSEAEKPIEEYRSLVDLFTRRLRPGARPVDPAADAVVSPVDGACSGAGRVEAGRIPVAPGRELDVADLLADPAAARRFEGGAYAVLYLSPRDYHRVHAPVAGRVASWTHVPGRLFPVFASAVRGVDRLFCRNERLVAWLDSALGPVAVVLVGAFGVGRIRASFRDGVTNDGARAVTRGAPSPACAVERGGELGMFELGSTVVLLFEPGRVHLDVRPGDAVWVGRRIGRAVLQ